MAEFNYFNFFTEVEEYFWRKRGGHILVSPLDWALLETWQKAGIPLEAVLKGIDRAFESYARSRRGAAGRPLKSLAYCTEAVVEAAAEGREAASGQGPRPSRKNAAEPFSRAEVREYFQRNIQRLRAAAEIQRASLLSVTVRLDEAAVRLAEMLPLLDSPEKFELPEPRNTLDLEDLERRLTLQEEKISAALAGDAPDDLLLSIRREMDRALGPYSRKMDAGQRALLEKQYQQKRLYDEFRIPRLSLFYLV
jgi:hypothetical protein